MSTVTNLSTDHKVIEFTLIERLMMLCFLALIYISIGLFFSVLHQCLLLPAGLPAYSSYLYWGVAVFSLYVKSLPVFINDQAKNSLITTVITNCVFNGKCYDYEELKKARTNGKSILLKSALFTLITLLVSFLINV
ncbi:hypothetical protein [Photobacterium leiognathi]|uniref:hypothetical protein n=1 Tax=Photobacterium leiognathi TaxID=553611 RepID=UPI0029817C8D|nr:hypothetical protein [Photobacterium leiognathi]